MPVTWHPLRLHLVENYYRLTDTVRQADVGGGRYEAVLAVSDPAEISAKGCRVVQRHWLIFGYSTACLFAQLKKVRDDFPYLQLAADDDTRLAAFLLGVHQGYLSGLESSTSPSPASASRCGSVARTGC